MPATPRSALPFTQLIGQSRAVEQIQAWLEGDRLPHAILVSGSEGVGKRQLALELAKAINCQSPGSDACGHCRSCRKTESLNHPNVHILLPLPTGGGQRSDAQTLAAMHSAAAEYLQEEVTLIPRSGRNIPRDHIRLLQREMGYAPTEAPKRIGLIFEAESMRRVGANSLLKILEEPQQHAVFILVSSHPDRLLPTIISRCQRLPLAPLSRQELKASLAPGLDDERLEVAARSAAGSRGRAIATLDDEFTSTRELALSFIEAGLGEGKEEAYWAAQEEVGSASERARFEKFLGIGAVLLRDLFLLQHGREEHIVHVDRAGRLKRCLERIQSERLEAVAMELEHAQDGLIRNVSPPLLLARVWWQLLQSRAQAVA